MLPNISRKFKTGPSPEGVAPPSPTIESCGWMRSDVVLLLPLHSVDGFWSLAGRYGWGAPPCARIRRHTVGSPVPFTYSAESSRRLSPERPLPDPPAAVASVPPP